MYAGAYQQNQGFNQQQTQGMNQQNPPAPGAPTHINVESFSDDQIREHLKSRNLQTDGGRPIIVQRLKDEVNKAWSQYYAKSGQQGYGGPPGGFQGQQFYGGPGPYQGPHGRKVGNKFPNPNQGGGPKKKRRRNKPKLTEEERLKRQTEIENRRDEKKRRREEHKRREAEAKEKKRLKKLAAAEKQKQMEIEQRKLKEKRQRSEVFVYFDMKTFGEQLVRRLDPSGEKILSCQYDLSQKGFRVRFSEPNFAENCSQDSTTHNPRTVKVPNELVILPSPIESHCGFFLDPCNPGHPNKDKAFEWVHSQGVDSKTSDTRALALWKQTSLAQFAKYGKIANVYRERGFIVVQFTVAESATAMLETLWTDPTDCTGEINGVPMVYMKPGTPKKRDRQECDKMYPKPAKKRRSQKKAQAQVVKAPVEAPTPVPSNTAETTVTAVGPQG